MASPTVSLLRSPASDLSPAQLDERRERTFLLFAAIFLGTLTMLNILGISRFVDLSFTIAGVQIPFVVAVGVLPYPVTFLCTDFMSEFFGQKRTNYVVILGVLLNLWVVFILWLGGVLPPQPTIDPATGLPPVGEYGRVFFEIKHLAFGAVGASMVAYLAAQLCDVHLFHFWKRLTKGKHLWLRNNASTLVSQVVDTVAVIPITHFYANGLPIDADSPLWPQLFTFIASGYVFKMVCALVDTLPFYWGSAWLSRYLDIDPTAVHD